MIRISTSYTQEQGVQYMRDAQKRVVDTQAELATGKRISSPSDDPVGAARLIDLHHQIDSTARFQTNIAMATGRLATSDSILDEAGQLTQRARELVVQANNAPLADSDRVSIAQELRQIRGQLLEHANSKDGNGDYLYAGYKTQTTPFIETAGGQVVYQGDSGQRLLGIGDQVAINVWESAGLTTDATIRPDGNITMPLIGDLRAVGNTPTELKAMIKAKLADFIKLGSGSEITVAVRGANSYRFTVSGEVTRPGIIQLGYFVTVVEAIASGKYAFVLVNFANPDMVGHTGVLPAAIAAVETIDDCLGRLVAAATQAGASLLITADHGNCELMVDPETGQPHTAHTTNPVPFILVDEALRERRLHTGGLKDVAPTILELMGLPKPAEMTGASLLDPVSAT